MASVARDGHDHRRCGLCEIEPIDFLGDDAADDALDVRFVDDLDDERQIRAGRANRAPGMTVVGKPAQDVLGKIQLRELRRDVLGRKEIHLDELAELRADTIFVPRDDRGVRERQSAGGAERAACAAFRSPSAI